MVKRRQQLLSSSSVPPTEWPFPVQKPEYIFCPPEGGPQPHFSFLFNAPSEEDMQDPKKLRAWMLLASHEHAAWVHQMLSSCEPGMVASGNTAACIFLGRALVHAERRLGRTQTAILQALTE